MFFYQFFMAAIFTYTLAFFPSAFNFLMIMHRRWYNVESTLIANCVYTCVAAHICLWLVGWGPGVGYAPPAARVIWRRNWVLNLYPVDFGVRDELVNNQRHKNIKLPRFFAFFFFLVGYYKNRDSFPKLIKVVHGLFTCQACNPVYGLKFTFAMGCLHLRGK